MEPFDTWQKLALEQGFTYAWELDAQKLKFYPWVREMCAQDKCSHYNRSWVCPPALGDLSVGQKKASAYTRGILLQTVEELPDLSDRVKIMAMADRHTHNFDRLHRKLRTQYPDLFAMGAGSCSRCSPCTWPTAPCRLPQIAVSSMEAWGLMVSEVCADCGAPYSYGPNTLMFASCFLLEKAG